MEPECPGCRERDGRIAALEERVAVLEARLSQLLPPLPPRAPASPPARPAKKPTGRKPGGQPGHPPHLKALLPPERVQHTVCYFPVVCAHCSTALSPNPSPDDPPPTRHQVAELPPLVAEITEYQGQARTCPACSTVTLASIPEAIRAHSVGPRLSAALSYLAGCHGVSKRGLEEICEALFQVPIALGTIANLEQEMSAALASAHQEAITAVRQAPVKCVDETGWKQAGRKRWLWAATTTTVTVFLIDLFRNVTALRKLLGPTFHGVMGTDRWSAYDHVEPLKRQICWAHLKRNWEKMQERGGKAEKIATACLSVQKRMFDEWHLFRGGGRNRHQLDAAMVPLMWELREYLCAGQRCRDRKTQRSCVRLLKVYAALWTFVVEEGVEPTNNQVESAQRRAVLWRRRSFGCHSAEGCRFVERILTVVQTLRVQGRSVLQYLHEAITNHRAAVPGPIFVMGR